MDMRFLAALIVVLALAMPGTADAGPNCVKGKTLRQFLHRQG
jgi:hypothetical protein